ncbi:Peptidyl-prolyl cis-trans isomerase pin4 [Malassezia brasiliensis]|uniref:Peptidyl-prolyl cis-trans isomerase pin4 n=1 Tax=Malassezia brasiliensis TaxID=1821822 RepID=A0AAF0DUV3_9BASI|nr:Peptidyl-prolyl cis-trans isomerase pin4 [Malassezia brasiliensis]
MPDQDLLQSFDSLHVGRAASPVAPHVEGRATDRTFTPNSAPLDAPLSFSPFHQPRTLPTTPEDGAQNLYASRFQHLFANGVGPVDGGGHADADAFVQPGLAPPATSELGHIGGFDAAPGAAPSGRTGMPFFSHTWAAPNAATPGVSYGAPGSDRGTLLAPSALPAPLQLGTGPIRFGSKLPSAPAPSSGESDIIPTAIVIKNIPFNIKREQLLHVIRDLGIPVPYAFNYHFDQGIFRGLAFANFHTPAEASEVVAALNGLDVSGRKLRVEYKKVLQAGEKERIEKEKAIKRMQQPHAGDKERKKDKALAPELTHLPPLSVSPVPRRMASPNSVLLNGLSPPSSTSSVSPNAHKEAKGGFEAAVSGTHPPPFRQHDTSTDAPLDLNDAETLEIYSRVLLFRDDRMRDELAFSKSLTSAERRTVHLVAQKLGLYHYTIGAPDDCYVLVSKWERGASTSASTPEPRMDLRAKKSVPDMKRASLHHDRDALYEFQRAMSARSGLLAPTLPMSSHASSGNLREAGGFVQDRHMDTFAHLAPPPSAGGNVFASPFDIPVVPHLTRPTSADIERLEPYPKHPQPALFRTRSPLAPPHTGAASSVGTLSHSTSALDNVGAPPLPGAGAAGLPHRPHPTRNLPVDLMLDGHAPKSRIRIPRASNASTPDLKREARKLHDAHTTDHDTTS